MVLQQGCCPIPIWQSPAIFLQHAISAAVICGFGRHASAGIASHRASKTNTMTERHRAITRCYPHPVYCGKWLATKTPVKRAEARAFFLIAYGTTRSRALPDPRRVACFCGGHLNLGAPFLGEAGLVRINDWTWWEEKIRRSAG
jgi:hypothetical protein